MTIGVVENLDVAKALLSMTTADLASTPRHPALAIADSSGGVVESTTAHGEATIMNVMARNCAETAGGRLYELHAGDLRDDLSRATPSPGDRISRPLRAELGRSGRLS
ncbi:hypothetical protein [Streptomyces rishiriensis]|uniref:hypothetical protein n=1 Tax=Streptomyces rishiriensis TaxID=68264 RepID=UPI00142D8D7A|nr:hypothetical protein [Streptomyces rishiriensis]